MTPTSTTSDLIMERAQARLAARAYLTVGLDFNSVERRLLTKFRRPTLVDRAEQSERINGRCVVEDHSSGPSVLGSDPVNDANAEVGLSFKA